jgi:hypothetical protein
MVAKAKHVIGQIDQYEQEQDSSKPFEDVILLPIPMPLYKALSDAASKRGYSVADLIALGFTRALEG